MPQSGILLEMFYWWFFNQSICGSLNILFNRASGFWTLSEKSTTGQPCVMQPRETMSTCEERYRATFSGVTPPLASIRRAGNSSFSAWAVTRSSCRWKERCNHGTKTTISLGLCFYNICHLRLKVVQHDDVCSRSGCLPALLCWTTLHLNLTAEAAHRAGSFHRLGSKQGCAFVFVCFLVSTADLMRAVRPELQNLDKGK